MFHLLYPEAESASAYEIDFEKAYRSGMRGVLFDVDNTLVPHGAPADERAVALFKRLRAIGFSTCLISNNDKNRVEPFAKAVGSEFVFNAHKPAAKSYRRAMEQMGTKPQTTLFVGDQLFTDVLGANRAGMHTCLVSPIHPKEEIQIVLKRYLERVVLYFYHRQRKKRQ